MTDLQRIFQDSEEQFEDCALANGGLFWSSWDLMEMLGYQDPKSFLKAVNRAISACTTLGINVADNFKQTVTQVDGEEKRGYKLSRFACFLVVMNGDPKKPQVAKAQAFFASAAESVRQAQEQDVRRVLTRGEITEREKSLSGVVKKAGIEIYPFFQNAGYVGMYNMSLKVLRARRGLSDSDTPLDYMGHTELAGNLFRITQTEEKIKNESIRGQRNLERVAGEVGGKVREAMIDISGVPPEDLPVETNIKVVHRLLKRSHKEMKALDVPKKKANE